MTREVVEAPSTFVHRKRLTGGGGVDNTVLLEMTHQLTRSHSSLERKHQAKHKANSDTANRTKGPEICFGRSSESEGPTLRDSCRFQRASKRTGSGIGRRGRAL